MSRDRSHSTGANSGHGSDDQHAHAPHRRRKNGRYGSGGRHGGGGNAAHGNGNVGGGGHRYHEMTLLCHRVDVFDDFVAPNEWGRGAPERCVGLERGCACHTPCAFCHAVVEDHLPGAPVAAPGEDGIPPDLALLFSAKAASRAADVEAAKTPPGVGEGVVEPPSSLVVDQIFAKNHGLLCDDVEGGIRVKKYHHPPVGRFEFTLPPQELPKFFDDSGDPNENRHEGCKENAGKQGKKEHDDSGLDSFFDDFTVAPKPVAQHLVKKECDENERVLVFRSPLKTVVKKADPESSGKCYCEQRHDFLAGGPSRQQQRNPHDPSVVHDKYWAQRRRLFHRFDEGIQLDAQGWYSVTPEAVANHVASRFAEAAEQLQRRPADGGRHRNARVGSGKTGDGGNRHNNRRGPTGARGGSTPPGGRPMVVLDAFCGCGGNAIAFARLPPAVVSLVVCVDVDRVKLRMAARNASIYGVRPDRIVFVEANSVAVMERCYRDGRLIMDPPPRGAGTVLPPREDVGGFAVGGVDLLPGRAPRIDAVFMDPPWGGIDYGASGRDGYDLARDMRIRGCERGCVGFPPTPEVDGHRLLRIAAAAAGTRFVAYDLPRNANKRSVALAGLGAGYGGNAKLEEHYLNGRLKTVTAYFGRDFRYLLNLRKYHGTGDCGRGRAPACTQGTGGAWTTV